MPSEKQIAANQANARKSTGPKSEAGKKRSALNALRHGLTGQVVVLPEEDLAAFKAFSTELVATFAPADAHERQLAQSYASYQWRINRAAAIEDNMFTLGLMEEIAENLNLEHPEVHNATSNAKTFRADAAEFQRLCLYNQRLVNQAEKVLKQLKQAQAERRQRLQDQLDEAAAIYAAHAAQAVTFDPAEIGFEFSLPQIVSHYRRKNLADPRFLAEEIQRNHSTAA